MKKLYFLIILSFYNIFNAQNSLDRDSDFNRVNFPLNHYFVDAEVTKCHVLSDGKILLIKNNLELIRLDNNLFDNTFNTGSGFLSATAGDPETINDFVVQPDGKIIVIGNFITYKGFTKKKDY